MSSRPADLLIARAVRRGGPWLAALTATALLGAAADLMLPAALGHAVDAVVRTQAGPEAGFGLTGPLTTAALLVSLVVACDALGVLAAGVSGARAAQWLRSRVVAHTLSVGAGMTRHFTAGEIVTRAGVNVEEAGRTPEAVVTAATLIIPAAGSVVALALIDPWLAVTLVAGLLLIVAVLRAFMRRTTAASGGYQQAQGEIAAMLVGALAGARTITAAGTEDLEAARVLAPLPACAPTAWRCGACRRGRASRPPSSSRFWRSPCSPSAGCACRPAASPSGSCSPPRATSCSGRAWGRRSDTRPASPVPDRPPGAWSSCSPCRPRRTGTGRCRRARAPWNCAT
ncbi:hypothetical protein GCM10027612_58130 [Microbispora bryophytorum subsp. camponoti]